MAAPNGTSSVGNSGSANVTSCVVNVPDNLAAGDLLIIGIGKDGTGTITWPGSPTFTVLDSQATDSHFMEVRYRIIDGSEGWSGVGNSFTVTGASEMYDYVVYHVPAAEFSGAAPEAATIAFNSGGTVNPDPPSLTPSWGADDTRWIAIYSWDGLSSHSSYPANYTDDQDWTRNSGSSSAQCNIAIATRALNAASENPGTATIAVAEEWAAITVAVEPAGGVAPGEVTLTPATATLSAIELAPVPQPVTVALTPATVTAQAVALAAVPQPVTVALTPAELSAVAVPLSTSIPPGSVDLTPAVVTVEAVPLTNVVTVNLTPAVVSVTAVPLNPVPGPVAVSLSTAVVTAVAPALVPVPMPVSVELAPANVAAQAVPLALVPGEVTMTLTPAVVTVEAPALTIVSGWEPTIDVTVRVRPTRVRRAVVVKPTRDVTAALYTRANVTRETREVRT